MIHDNFGLRREGVVVTSTIEKINGVVTLPTWWNVETDLGTLIPDGARTKAISFPSKVEPAQQRVDDPKTSQPNRGGRNKPGGGKPDPEPKP